MIYYCFQINNYRKIKIYRTDENPFLYGIMFIESWLFV